MSIVTERILTAQERLEYELINKAPDFTRIEGGSFDDVFTPINWIIGAHGTKGGANYIPRRLNSADRELLIAYMKTKGWLMTYITADSFFHFLGLANDRIHLIMITPPPPKAG